MKNYCKSCGKIISKVSTQCKSCVRIGKQYIKLSKKYLYQKYIIEDKSAKEIARLKETNICTVLRRLREFNISIREIGLNTNKSLKRNKTLLKGKNNPNYKGGKPKCRICKKIISYNSKICRICLFEEKHKNKQSKEEIRRKARIYYHLHKKEYQLLQNLRCRVRDALQGKAKSLSTMKLIGCSIEYLKRYLEKRFTKGMSWENYGKWHVDHIKRCADFDLSKKSEQLKCFNYKNLQPLWAVDNFTKHCRTK